MRRSSICFARNVADEEEKLSDAVLSGSSTVDIIGKAISVG